MADELQKAHLYYDDINKIRILEQNVLKDTEDLKDTCKEYETKVKDFGKIISTLLETLKELGENVEKQKMAALGSMNLLKSITKQRENDQAKLQVLGDPYFQVGRSRYEQYPHRPTRTEDTFVFKCIFAWNKGAKASDVKRAANLSKFSRHKKTKRPPLNRSEISERSIELEQLDAEYDSLQILEASQMETIEYLTALR